MNPQDLAAYLTCAAFVGGFLSHLLRKLLDRRSAYRKELAQLKADQETTKAELQKEQKQTAEVVQHLYWAVVGKPADAYSAEMPGLLQEVRELSAMTASNRTRLDRHEEFHTDVVLPLTERKEGPDGN